MTRVPLQNSAGQKTTEDLSVATNKRLILFTVLKCGRSDERRDFIGFTTRTIPSDSIVYSGEQGTSLDSARSVRRKRRRDAADDLTEYLHECKKVLHGHQAAQNRASRSELLSQMKQITEKRR